MGDRLDTDLSVVGRIERGQAGGLRWHTLQRFSAYSTSTCISSLTRCPKAKKTAP
jgi:hypothetical protein